MLVDRRFGDVVRKVAIAPQALSETTNTASAKAERDCTSLRAAFDPGSGQILLERPRDCKRCALSRAACGTLRPTNLAAYREPVAGKGWSQKMMRDVAMHREYQYADARRADAEMR